MIERKARHAGDDVPIAGRKVCPDHTVYLQDQFFVHAVSEACANIWRRMMCASSSCRPASSIPRYGRVRDPQTLAAYKANKSHRRRHRCRYRGWLILALPASQRAHRAGNRHHADTAEILNAGPGAQGVARPPPQRMELRPYGNRPNTAASAGPMEASGHARHFISIDDHEFVVLLGPRAAARPRFCAPPGWKMSARAIAIDGKRVNDASAGDRDIAMVFQNYALYPAR